MSLYTTERVVTRQGLATDVRVYAGATSDATSDVTSGLQTDPTLVFFHGESGMFDDEPLLAALASTHRVVAPVLPGFGPEENSGETTLDDMLAVTLHGWDIVDALNKQQHLGPVHLAGHSMGAMIGAEMAALCPDRVAKLSLISPLGMWVDDSPIPDLFAMLPFEFPQVLFRDSELGTALLTTGLNFEDPAAIERFQIRNSRRLGFSGKLLFPVPNRRLSTRSYRITAPTTIVWGADDVFTKVNPYRAVWDTAITGATSSVVAGAGHCVHLERPAEVAALILA
jgi:pimeloyl-ACP methyl ester carboxylesterase